ncbi:MAG: division/cell wall cluster transcriptional repressor MraZ [Rhodocyclaceae bacterium]|nr:division/cell wall cluster transcriptional repressor MraZ [Rhodocyclaceae bacterium]MBP7081072.1 division/cell wall cluster transcriptional repressor MraZ [Rhodocyclaceae bacterium]
MFQGAAPLSLDAKGRLAVPAKHRDALVAAGEGRLVLTAHPHGCLLLYPQPTWVPIRAQIVALSSFSAQTAAARRLLVGFAEDVELDSAGRLLVSPSLRQYAHFEKDIWFVGQGGNFEIWSDAGWRAQQVSMSALGDTPLAAGLDNLAL